MLKRVFVHRLETCKIPWKGEVTPWQSRSLAIQKEPTTRKSNKSKNFESKIDTGSLKNKSPQKIIGPQNNPTFFRVQTPSIGGFVVALDHFPKQNSLKPPAQPKNQPGSEKTAGGSSFACIFSESIFFRFWRVPADS